MHDPAAEELGLALKLFCDEVLSDVTIPTNWGVIARVHWLYRDREFRATVPVWADGAPPFTIGAYADWRRHGGQFFHLPSHPVFEARGDDTAWEDVLNVGIWHFMLRSAGRRRGGDDQRPGGLARRPVRPMPAPPNSSAGAEAVPELEPRERRRYPHPASGAPLTQQ